MKLLSICFALCCSLSLLAQVPQAIAYQAVATDLDGNELIEQNIQIKATVISQGLELWVETHQTQTDEFGLFVIEIGNGTRIAGSNANFEDISWFADDHFLKIDMDPAGGNNFEFVGTTQMLSVPYAFQTKRAANADVADQAIYADSAGFAINDMDTSPTNELQDINYDPMTGTFSITGGNSFVLDTDDQDSDPTNEIQTLAFDGVNISLLDADGNVTNSVDLSQFAFAGPGSNLTFPKV